jgi:excisionase family DNA binding protein
VWIGNENLLNIDEKTFGNNGNLMTPAEVAEKLRVTAEQVRILIRKGRISATNVGTGSKRPLYRISQKAFDEFLIQGSLPKQPMQKKKFTRLPPSPDFFPDLK